VNVLISTVKKKTSEFHQTNIALLSHKRVRQIWMGN